MTASLPAENELAVPLARHERTRPLVVRNGSLFVSRGQTLFEKKGTEGARKLLTPCTNFVSKMSRLWFVERVLRADIHSMTFRPDGNALLTLKGRIVCLNMARGLVIGTFTIPGGSRPLRIENTANGNSYFGEYSANTSRRAVPIYGSEDGIHWERVYEFPRSTIRHVHGIFYDRIRDGMWVLTGDDGDETGLWFTDDDFSNLTPVVRGGQQCRAVTVFAVPSGLIVPMDSPDQQNYIHHFDINSGRFEKLVKLPGSSLASMADGACMLVSTAVERSQVNLDQRVSVFGSVDGVKWVCIARLKRDWPIMKNLRPYFQHPNVRFASSDGSSDRIYASCIAVKGYDGRMVSWSRDEIVEYIDGST